jgi:signal transduction histidine kinase
MPELARSSGEVLQEAVRTREILRQASVSLQGRVVTLWTIATEGDAVPEVTSELYPGYHATALDVPGTLGQWGVPIAEHSRWVGCRLVMDGRWCVAPVRRDPPAPPPGGQERRSRERMTLELAGLCVGLLERAEHGNGAAREAAGEQTTSRIVAHEVANPLAAARATLELCVRNLQEDPAHENVRTAILDDLTNVVREIERAAALLRSVSERARGGTPHHERFDIVSVLRSCVTLEGPLAEARGGSLEFHSSIDQLFLDGDPNALYQILVNLTRNALDATGEKGTPVVVSLEFVGTRLELTVADEGTGIPPEHLSRIFESGFTTKPAGAGSGMGLSVVRDLAQEAFEGKVRVDSELGRGTSVTVSLPMPRQRRSEPSFPTNE